MSGSSACTPPHCCTPSATVSSSSPRPDNRQRRAWINASEAIAGVLPLDLYAAEGIPPSARRSWPPYHWLENPEIRSFAGDFWNPRFDDSDIAMYNRFLDILKLSESGLNGDEIGRILNMNNVRKYITGDKMSFLTNLRAEHDRLGPPTEEHKWLPLGLKPRGTPDGTWIQVPAKINSIGDITSVLDQRETLENAFSAMREFGYNSPQELLEEKILLFGFLVGATIGDAGKHRKGESRFQSKSLSLVLSQNKPNSYRFGQFTALCAQASLGLEMHRIADAPVSRSRYSDSECFQWISRASPMVGWLFHDCLGLNGEELTTYHPLRMDWLVGTPSTFKTGVLQGVSESDGWVDAGDDTVCFVSSPNTPLFSSTLMSLGLKHRVDHHKSVDVIRVPTEEGAKLPIFNPRIRSVYFEQLEIMSHARRLPERVRLPDEAIQYIRELAIGVQTLSAICLELARIRGIKVTSQTVRKYIG